MKELEEENLRLKEELRCARVQNTLESTGSAESIIPLPQGHSSALTPVLTVLLTQMIFRLMIACHGLTISNHSKSLFQTYFPMSGMKK